MQIRKALAISPGSSEICPYPLHASIPSCLYKSQSPHAFVNAGWRSQITRRTLSRLTLFSDIFHFNGRSSAVVLSERDSARRALLANEEQDTGKSEINSDENKD